MRLTAKKRGRIIVSNQGNRYPTPDEVMSISEIEGSSIIVVSSKEQLAVWLKGLSPINVALADFNESHDEASFVLGEILQALSRDVPQSIA